MEKLFSVGEIKIIQIKLTQLCNKQCSYCCAGNGDYIARWNEYSEDTELLFKKLELLIEKFSHTFSKNLMIEINGGEPLLMMDRVLQIINLFNKYANKFVIFTNGELFDESTNDILISKYNNVEFNIGFDTTQKSVFRFNDIQKSIISKLGKEKKLRGVFVVDGWKDIPKIAKHAKSIDELTGLIPTIEYNAFKVEELMINESLIYDMKEQIDQLNIINHGSGRNSSCDCGIINVLPNGTINTCLESLSPDLDYNACMEFIDNNCSKCEYKNRCSNCLLSINQYKGKLYCKMKSILQMNF